ncbi:Ubiquitin carboxyl-terminal hydrolase MINDY-3 [Lamellibrachia satsuma]|nr:Ubiquitin carboxyl-terminal hydrolase MINDY-3 [Lamellibrachia satsuma]
MASASVGGGEVIAPKLMTDATRLLWGPDIKHDVFRRWTQGFVFSEDEPTALLQLQGGPCAVIVPVQAFLLKNLLFLDTPADKWRHVTEKQQQMLLCRALEDILHSIVRTESYLLVSHHADTYNGGDDGNDVDLDDESGSGTSSPKKQCFSHDQFHLGLRCHRCSSRGELSHQLQTQLEMYLGQYGVLLLLYSIILTKGIDQIKNEVEDPNEPLIDGIHGHGSQSLINLLITGTAVSNVWDNAKYISGLKLQGVCGQAQVGFLTLLEHMRYCEVGWYLKNPCYPIWVLGSETHLTVLFSQEQNLVMSETPEAAARRLFNTYDTEGSGFISGDLLGDLMQSLNLVSDEDYVKIMREKMDPEELGIITLNGFMDEFFPSNAQSEAIQTFTVFHYNGLPSSGPGHKVMYVEGTAVIMEMPELQIITDSSPVKMCLLTKWPTVELKWKDNFIPSLN